MKRPKEANKVNDLKRPEKANKVNEVKLPEDVNERNIIRGNECPDTIKRVVPPVVIGEKKAQKKNENQHLAPQMIKSGLASRSISMPFSTRMPLKTNPEENAFFDENCLSPSSDENLSSSLTEGPPETLQGQDIS